MSLRSVPERPPNWVLQRIRECLNYDPKSGILIWVKPQCSRLRVGQRAGSSRFNPSPYRVINFGSVGQRARHCFEHHVVWYLMTGEWPTKQIDHRDRNGLNNQWANLRLATTHQQQLNKRSSRPNTIGFKGLRRVKSGFVAQISIKGKNKYLGRFSSREEAAAAYEAAVKIYHDQKFRSPL